MIIQDKWVLAKETDISGTVGYLKRLDPGNIKVMGETMKTAQRFNHEQAVSLGKQLNLVPVRLRRGGVVR